MTVSGREIIAYTVIHARRMTEILIVAVCVWALEIGRPKAWQNSTLKLVDPWFMLPDYSLSTIDVVAGHPATLK